MQTRKPADTKEPDIQREEILFLNDDRFNQNNVCIVTGAATGIGRATAIASAANNLMTIGLDINAEEGNKTQKKASGGLVRAGQGRRAAMAATG